MSNDLEFIEVNEVPLNNLQMYQQDKAMIDIQIATAKAYPRNLKKAIENAIVIVTMDLEIAESCTYSLKKGKTISGPSVYLARILLGQMTNIRAENRVIGYDQTHVTCEAICFDLEKNFAVRTQIKRSIVGNSGRYTEDQCVITGNAGNAVALRNAVFTVIGAEVVNIVYKAAKQKITGDISDKNKFITRRNLIFDGFKSAYSTMKLTDEEICKSVNKSSVEHINADDLVILIGYDKSLKEGETTPESLFRPPETREKFRSKPAPQDKSDSRILELINSRKTRAELEKLLPDCITLESKQAYDNKFKELK